MPNTYADFQRLYREKLTDVEGALALIQSGDNLCLGKDCNEPQEFCRALHTIAPRVENVSVLKGRSSDYGFLQNDGMNGHILTQSAFFARGWDEPLRKGNVTFVACDLYDQPYSYNAAYPRNAYIVAATPMDENGNFQVNLSLMWEWDIWQQKLCQQKVIIEENKQLKRVEGGMDIHISQVTAVYQADYQPPEIPDLVPSETEDKIGQYVGRLINDGDCIQLGIGTLPNACASHMMDKHDLGIHSEMFTNLMGEMVRKGVITGARKNINPGEHTFCFAGGTQSLYDYLHEDKNCVIRPSSYVTDPRVIMENNNMKSINGILEIDLTGQVCSESIGTRQYSGPGGGFDFAYGAQHAKNGRSILILQSRTKKGQPKIKSTLTPGAQVTIPRPYADTVVTEYGIAELKGRTLQDRVKALIAIAHPEDRDRLRFEAEQLMYI
ncbi:MAG: 4-hydroxybutyrate--acetyl-CoA CoA transferase [Oscillospiraceae bacterium]|nr:4-hydroxybutyrate--acetyl-CoA CoA transferase [Oscillospiraceae bacterium]